jgi:hypothetical protein
MVSETDNLDTDKQREPRGGSGTWKHPVQLVPERSLNLQGIGGRKPRP